MLTPNRSKASCRAGRDIASGYHCHPLEIPRIIRPHDNTMRGIPKKTKINKLGQGANSEHQDHQ